jgi:hypothetical protein
MQYPMKRPYGCSEVARPQGLGHPTLYPSDFPSTGEAVVTSSSLSLESSSTSGHSSNPYAAGIVSITSGHSSKPYAAGIVSITSGHSSNPYAVGIVSGEFHDQGDNGKQGDHLIPRCEGIAT